MKKKPLIIFGTGAFAEIAFEYFNKDSIYDVVCFTVDKSYLKQNEFFGLPVIPFENIEDFFGPKENDFFAAITYTQLNRLRTFTVQKALQKGYNLASYISSKAFIWPNVSLGKHCFIFENNTLQPFSKIGENVILWSNNHVGHHSYIGNNCFVSSHVVISGFCKIGSNSFLGVNSTIIDNVTIGEDNWIGANVLINKNTEKNILFKNNQTEPSKVSSKSFFKIK